MPEQPDRHILSIDTSALSLTFCSNEDFSGACWLNNFKLSLNQHTFFVNLKLTVSLLPRTLSPHPSPRNSSKSQPSSQPISFEMTKTREIKRVTSFVQHYFSHLLSYYPETLSALAGQQYFFMKRQKQGGDLIELHFPSLQKEQLNAAECIFRSRWTLQKIKKMHHTALNWILHEETSTALKAAIGRNTQQWSAIFAQEKYYHYGTAVLLLSGILCLFFHANIAAAIIMSFAVVTHTILRPLGLRIAAAPLLRKTTPVVGKITASASPSGGYVVPTSSRKPQRNEAKHGGYRALSGDGSSDDEKEDKAGNHTLLAMSPSRLVPATARTPLLTRTLDESEPLQIEMTPTSDHTPPHTASSEHAYTRLL